MKVFIDDFSIKRRQKLSIHLNCPHEHFIPLIQFSPNLDWLLVANLIVHVESCQPKVMHLPIPPMTSSERDFVKFSLCGRYIAVKTFEEGSHLRSRSELHVFAIDEEDNDFKKRYHLESMNGDRIEKVSGRLNISFHFHPNMPEILLQRQLEINKVNLEFIDLRAWPPTSFQLTVTHEQGEIAPSCF